MEPRSVVIRTRIIEVAIFGLTMGVEALKMGPFSTGGIPKGNLHDLIIYNYDGLLNRNVIHNI